MNNYIKEFRDKDQVKKFSDILSKYTGKYVTIMEVCGTHTMALSRYGIRSIVSRNIRLISGPGCPVCVTPSDFINSALELAKKSDVIITTFGDMMRIPVGSMSLIKQKSLGGDIRILYSPFDALEIAKDNPSKKVVFLSVGFETTNPVIALTVQKANQLNLKNFYILTANKTIPNALKALICDESIKVDGFLYPGHVSAATGTNLYKEIAKEYGVPGVVAGFEPLDILNSIITLISTINSGQSTVTNTYKRVVEEEGNQKAMTVVNEVFEPCDAVWRGLGEIPQSGLRLKEKYRQFDARWQFELSDTYCEEPKGCKCGEILKGKISPKECPLFGSACTPDTPVGACMVSSEGTCAAFYSYEML